ncbi:glycoside hydrolase [Chloroflexi bacterium TSY]|nr:glycoside hydrolase [Chloroflexi bacterium TSY]
MKVTDAESTLAYIDREHACNQGSIVQLANGELLLGFNQERTRIHSDSGQSCLIRSSDGGRTWDPDTMTVVYPYTEFDGNWDCAFAQTADGTIIMHTRLCSFMAPTALRRSDEQALQGG